jgi:hypothetical protein
MILTHGYYEHEGVWDLALGFDKQAMAEIIAAFRPARTLEIGCASGTVLHYLASLGLPCEGIGDQAAKATDDAACTKFVEEAMVALNREPFAVYLYSLDDLYGVQRWVQGFLPRLDQTIRVTSMGVTPK